MTQNYSRDFCRSGRPTTIQYSSSRNQFQTFLEGKLVVGCLWLQHMLRGIKHHQGSKHQHESITIELMHIIFQSLNFYKPYNTLGCLLSRVFWILIPLNRQRLTSSIQSILSAAGVLVARLVIASALAQLFQQPVVAYQITSPRHLANGSRYVSDLYALPSLLSWG